MRHQDKIMQDLKAAEIIQTEWEIRRRHCWRQLQTYLIASASVSIAPYLAERAKIAALGKLVLALPLMGGLMALVGVWLFAAEYVRCQGVLESYKSILEKHGRHEKPLPPILRWPIGWTIVWSAGIGALLLSLLNIYAISIIFL